MPVHSHGPLGGPDELVHHPQLEPEVKRSILVSWASDAFAVHSQPTLRKPPELQRPVPGSDVLDALKRLDTGERRSGPA